MGSLQVWLSYHPPSHILEHHSVYSTLCSGGKVGFYRGSMEHVCINYNTKDSTGECRYLVLHTYIAYCRVGQVLCEYVLHD